MKIYHVDQCKNLSSWIDKVSNVNKLSEADLVIFPGGCDVYPGIYKKKQHRTTHYNIDTDVRQVAIMKKTIELGIPMVGICRGAQLMCAIQPKGMLIQDMDHPSNHTINTFDKELISVNSLHHQMQYPFNMDKSDYRILGWANRISNKYKSEDEKDLDVPCEPEIVFYPKIKGLAIQHHPEMLTYASKSNRYLRDLLERFMNNSI
jgi:gamma-glutamyl-gamma-aminobutyrate hydrolase PuuD